MKDVEIPEIGESITEGTLASWLKEDGEYVEEQEDLFELETDKATLAVPSPASGILKIMAEEGADVKVGEVVARIDPGEAHTKPETAQGVDFEIKLENEALEKSPPTTLSPAVRRLVQQYRLDPIAIKGTGKNGRITKEDVHTHIEEQKKIQKPMKEIVLDLDKEQNPPENPHSHRKVREEESGTPAAVIKKPEKAAQREKRVRMTSIRKRMAKNLLHAKQSAAHVTTFNEIDMSQVKHLRKTYGESFTEKYGTRLGFMSFFIRACCSALAAYPVLNAEVDGEDIVYHDYYNIGIAVSTQRGLIVPVIRDAGALSFAEIEERIRDFITRAKEKKLTVSELMGGTFSITNGGVFGSLLSTPIPNPPQVAILGMHAINDRPVAVNAEVVVRPMMYVSLTYDHRIVEGREAVRFLVRVKECIEDPPRILIDI